MNAPKHSIDFKTVTSTDDLILRVINALIAQGPSYDTTEDLCVYRARAEYGETRACAVGLLIPEDQYYSTMEGEDIIGLRDKIAHGYWAGITREFEMFLNKHSETLSTLQRAHDFLAASRASYEKFKERLPGEVANGLRRRGHEVPESLSHLVTEKL